MLYRNPDPDPQTSKSREIPFQQEEALSRTTLKKVGFIYTSVVQGLLFMRKLQHGSSVYRDFNRFLLQNDHNVTAETRRRCYWLVSVLLNGRRKTRHRNLTQPLWCLKVFCHDHFYVESAALTQTMAYLAVLLGRITPQILGVNYKCNGFIQSSLQTNWPPIGNKR